MITIEIKKHERTEIFRLLEVWKPSILCTSLLQEDTIINDLVKGTEKCYHKITRTPRQV